MKTHLLFINWEANVKWRFSGLKPASIVGGFVGCGVDIEQTRLVVLFCDESLGRHLLDVNPCFGNQKLKFNQETPLQCCSCSIF